MQMALDCCKSRSALVRKEGNWTWHLLRAIRDTEYGMNVRNDGTDAIDITALRHGIMRRRDAIMVWGGLGICPRTVLVGPAHIKGHNCVPMPIGPQGQ